MSKSGLALITEIITEKLAATLVEIQDQSDRHKNHAGRKQAPIDSGHYDLLVVSPKFENLSLIQCHRLIYAVLAEQMQTQIHALSIRAYSPQQWKKM
jgi:BolA family transcriptional regulator, general stress-responsive regulator